MTDMTQAMTKFTDDRDISISVWVTYDPTKWKSSQPDYQSMDSAVYEFLTAPVVEMLEDNVADTGLVTDYYIERELLLNQPTRTSIKEAVSRLDALTDRDPAQAHVEADGVLLGMVPPEVAEAWERACGRAMFWYE